MYKAIIVIWVHTSIELCRDELVIGKSLHGVQGCPTTTAAMSQQVELEWCVTTDHLPVKLMLIAVGGGLCMRRYCRVIAGNLDDKILTHQ